MLPFGGIRPAFDRIGQGANPASSKTYLQRILATEAASLIGCWPLNDAPGSVAADASGHGYNGVASANVAFGQTGIGNGNTAATFTPQANINLLSSGFQNAWNGQEFTVLVWFNCNHWSDGAQRTLLYFRNTNHYLYINKATTVGQFFVTYFNTVNSTKTINSITKTGWTCLVVRGSLTGGVLDVSLDGEQQTQMTGVGTYTGSPTIMLLGNSSTSSGNAWADSLGPVAVWNSYLTYDQILHLSTVLDPVDKPGVLFQTDDGYLDWYNNIFGYQPQIKWTSYVITSAITAGQYNSFPCPSWAQLRAVRDAGHVIGSHTYDHQVLTGLNQVQNLAEWTNAAADLVANGLGEHAYLGSYPGGGVNANVETWAAQAGMLSVRSTSGGSVELPNLIDRFSFLANSITSANTYADMVGYITTAQALRKHCIIIIHKPVVTPSQGIEVSIANTKAILDYVVAQNLPTYTHDQLLAEIVRAQGG